MKKLLVLAALFAACDRPPVDSTEDPRQQAHQTHIAGSVVVQSKARGNVIVLLFDAQHLPPPDGFGRPISFAVVPKDVVFADAADGDSGPFTAPYAFTWISPGSYVIKGFIDANDDFIPWYFATADVDTGDVGGAAVDPVTFQPRVITVDADHAADGVPVSFADSQRVPVDRPAFNAGPLPQVNLGSNPAINLTLTLQPVNEGVVRQAQPVFLARFIDDNHDGVPDDANGDGVPDMWPKVVVRKTDANNPLLDENDLDRNGIIDDTGADYDHVNPTNGQTLLADGVPDAVVLAAGFDPTSIAPLLFDSMGMVKQTPTPVQQLTLVVKAQAFDVRDPAAPGVLKSVPAGKYAIYVIQETGQTWRLPNELMPGVGGPLGLPEVGTENFLIAAP